ncbi:hypothetical protein AB0J52_00110 [Spirillospora sp. NPDC049652]
MWATTWTTDANDLISPRLGLPQLPVVEWPEPSDVDEHDERMGLHWKTRHLVAWAAGRPFAWLDDELTDTDRTWVTHHHPAEALLHRINASRGVTTADLEALRQWLKAMTDAPRRRRP